MKQDFENSLVRRYHELFSHFKAFLLEDISHVSVDNCKNALVFIQ